MDAEHAEVARHLVHRERAGGGFRVDQELGGGPEWDIGIYCLNAARSIFRAEPSEVFAMETMGDGDRFAEVAESTSVLMRFPGERVAQFTCSFGASSVSSYRIIGAPVIGAPQRSASASTSPIPSRCEGRTTTAARA